jgi:tRNA (guanine-N7-)-methyltransferase
VGKGKLKRFQEMKTFNHVFQPGFTEVYQKDYKIKGKWAAEFFKNNNPIILELGCGKGEYTTGLAQRNPNCNYIGVDIKGARMWLGAKIAFEKQLNNVAFVRTRVDLIESFFGESEISEIWLTFSDPQPKKVKKRLSSSNFLSKYKKFLKKDGLIHIKTDSKLLFEYSLALAEKNKFFITFISRNVYNDENLPESVSAIQTFYEKQFLEEGKKIHYLQYKLNNKSHITEPEEFIQNEALKYKIED